MLNFDNNDPNKFTIRFAYDAVPRGYKYAATYSLDEGTTWITVEDPLFDTRKEAEAYAKEVGAERVQESLNNILSSITSDLLHGDD